MPRLFRRAVRRQGPDRFEVRFSDDERTGLRNLFEQLAATLTDDSDDPALRTLFPPTYGDDAVRDAGYQAMAGDGLRTARLETLATAARVTEASEVSEDELVACLQALNSLRLVLAARLGLTDDPETAERLDPSALDPADPDAQGLLLYHYLSALLDELVGVLAA